MSRGDFLKGLFRCLFSNDRESAKDELKLAVTDVVLIAAAVLTALFADKLPVFLYAPVLTADGVLILFILMLTVIIFYRLWDNCRRK